MLLSQSGFWKRVKTGRESDIFLKTKKFSAYDLAFEQHLIDYGIYPHGYDYDNDDGSVYPSAASRLESGKTFTRRQL